MITSVLVAVGMSTYAYAFESTEEEQAVIERYVSVSNSIEAFCSDESNPHETC